MKLRIRSLDTKETLKIEIASPPSLHNLKLAIAEKISVPPEKLSLSLNRKDKIEAAPRELLQSLGIASGDLIYYSLDLNGSSEGGDDHLQASIPQEMVQQVQTPKTLDQPEEQEAVMVCDEIDDSSNVVLGTSSSSSPSSRPSSSVPCFLRKVLGEEVVDPEEDHKLLVAVVHAVFLESGYVCFDTVEQQRIDGFRLPKGWESKFVAALSLQYTIPLGEGLIQNGLETVVLRFQVLGKYMKVYGSLSGKEGSLYRLCLDKSRFAPSIKFVQMNSDSEGTKMEGKDASGFESLKSLHEKEIFEFWKIVKDELALPLLIDLSIGMGLEPPSCFICLPTEIKLKILEYLPGIDIARASCVSSELRYIASQDDLWKLKFDEEFGDSNDLGNRWKEKFVASWETRKTREKLQEQRVVPTFLGVPYAFPHVQPMPFIMPGGRVPLPIGGDYDWLPAHGSFPAPFGSRRSLNLHSPARRHFTPPCHFDGSDL